MTSPEGIVTGVSKPTASARSGVKWALAAYAWWGFGPIYFKAVRHVVPLEVLAHRIVWSVALLVILATALGRWRDIRRVIGGRRELGLLSLTGALIALNWYVYIWAVAHAQVLEGSLGYFIGPLATVLLGWTVLGEHLSRTEWLAVVLAAVGVAWLTLSAGVVPWIALALAGTFAMYGLVRKVAGVSSIDALTIETGLLSPIALAYLVGLARSGELAFGSVSTSTDLLLCSAGAFTIVPLLCFGLAVRRLRLSTIGVLQYVGPTLQFLLAVAVYGEPFGAAHGVAFACIWTALAIFTADNLRRSR